MKALESKEQVFANGVKHGASKGKHHDLGGFFTPYGQNPTLRAEWVKGFKRGFKKESGVDYPTAAKESERICLFYEQLESAGVHGQRRAHKGAGASGEKS